MSFSTIIPFAEQKIKKLILVQYTPKKRFYVGTMLDLESFTKNHKPYLPQSQSLPAIYLFPEKNNANGNASIGYHLQKLEFTLGVMIVEQNLNNTRLQNDAQNLNQSLSNEQLVKNALMGASPSHQYTPFDLKTSSLYGQKESITFWKQSYTTSYFHVTTNAVTTKARS